MDQVLAGAVGRLLLPYQLRWLADRSRYKVGCWARQTGKSFVLTLEAVLQALGEQRDQLIFSASERQALENMEKVRQHLAFLQGVLALAPATGGRGAPAPGLLAPSDGGGKEEVRLANGAKILARPANFRTVRGFSGDVFWDEAAITQHDGEFWRSVFPIATRGSFRVRLTSTPMGDRGVFHDRWKDRSGRWTHHRVTLPEAVAEGLVLDVEAIRDSVDEEGWRQEYLCEFLSDAASYFPWELLQAAADLAPEELPPAESTWMGVDLGRKRDLTAIYEALELPGGRLHLRRLEVLRKVPFDQQEARIASLVGRPGVRRCCVDATWNSSISERLRRELGPVIEPVVFTAPVKEQLVIEVRRRLENGTLSLDGGDRELLGDFHAIRRFVTAANNVRFDADRTEAGHADRFWACALAVHGASRRGGWRVDFGGAAGEPERAGQKDQPPEATGFWEALGRDLGLGGEPTGR